MSFLDQLSQYVTEWRADSRPAGTELAFVFTEIDGEGNPALLVNYPAVYQDIEPTEDAPANAVNRLWVKLNNGAWQKVSSIPAVTNVGLGTSGVLQSGCVTWSEPINWIAKSIAAGITVATDATLDQINADRASSIALIRTYVNDDGPAPLAPDVPFTAGQVTALSTWINAHGITPAEFAALFDVSAAQLSDWLQTHSRLEFAKQIYSRFL